MSTERFIVELEVEVSSISPVAAIRCANLALDIGRWGSCRVVNVRKWATHPGVGDQSEFRIHPRHSKPSRTGNHNRQTANRIDNLYLGEGASFTHAKKKVLEILDDKDRRWEEHIKRGREEPNRVTGGYDERSRGRA